MSENDLTMTSNGDNGDTEWIKTIREKVQGLTEDSDKFNWTAFMSNAARVLRRARDAHDDDDDDEDEDKKDDDKKNDDDEGKEVDEDEEDEDSEEGGEDEIAEALAVLVRNGFKTARSLRNVSTKGSRTDFISEFKQLGANAANAFSLGNLFDHFCIEKPIIAKIAKKLQGDKRGESLELERCQQIPERFDKNEQRCLGQHLKFVNREKSINNLLKHAAKEYKNYLNKGTLQFAACSGSPGLGKTTFCRKAFTRAADELNLLSEIWKDVAQWEGLDMKKEFAGVVQRCVHAGRQYRVSFGGEGGRGVDDLEIADPAMSLAIRLIEVITGSSRLEVAEVNGPRLLRRVLSEITKGEKNSMVVINLDETNVLFENEEKRAKLYLEGLLKAVRKFNRTRSGFIYVILSGTNVRELHSAIKASSSGNSPEEMPLPLLQTKHVLVVLEHLLERAQKAEPLKKISKETRMKLAFVAQVLGGVPRYIEFLAFSLGEGTGGTFYSEKYCTALLSGQVDPHSLLDRVKNLMNNRYSEQFSSMVQNAPCQVLVAYSLFGWEVNRDTQFRDKIEGTRVMTVAELETNGVIFVQEDKLVFPLVLLLTFVAQSDQKGGLPLLLRSFEPMSSEDNERNTLAIVAMKCRALIGNDKKVTLEKLFPMELFPKLSRKFYKTELTFKDFEMKQARNHVTTKTWDVLVEKLKTAGGFVGNAMHAPFADMMLLRSGGDFAVLMQEKQSSTSKKHHADPSPSKKLKTSLYELVKTEHAKCNVSTEHLFVFITDEDFEGLDELKENEIVLSSKMHAAGFGNLLALLRKHNHNYRPGQLYLKN